MAPSGRRISLPFCEICQLDKQRRVLSAGCYYDQYGLLTQLGHIQRLAVARAACDCALSVSGLAYGTLGPALAEGLPSRTFARNGYAETKVTIHGRWQEWGNGRHAGHPTLLGRWSNTHPAINSRVNLHQPGVNCFDR